MSHRLTEDNLIPICKERNHILVDFSGYKNVKSRVKFHCLTCNNNFSSAVASYLNSKKTGCPFCKKKAISLFNQGKFVTPETRRKLSNKAKGRKGTLTGKFGPDHPAFKGNTGRDFKNLSHVYYRWRNQIRDHFGWKCPFTGANRTVVHHLDSWDWCEYGRYRLSNGICISRDLHKSFHDTYGYGKNTSFQFWEFIETQFSKAISSQVQSTLWKGSETTGEVEPS
jgi:hypothetical protein